VRSRINSIDQKGAVPILLTPIYFSADRHFDYHVLTIGTPAVLPLTVSAMTNVYRTIEFQMQQRIQRSVATQIRATAVTTITAIRTAMGTVLLSQEAAAAVSAVTCFYVDPY
jgi:hypothetical protein